MIRHRRSNPLKRRPPILQVERLEPREVFSATMIPVNDLGTGTYGGFEGGLYPNGTDTPPAGTESFALSLAQQIVPLDASGNPDPVNGKILMTSIGMSNTGVEFVTFIPQADADPAKNPQLEIVNGAQGGNDALSWLDPQATSWNVLDSDLAAAGVTPQQVQVVWFKEALQRPWSYGEFPLHAQAYQQDIETIDRNILIRYPNTKLVYMSTRTHAYTTDHTSPNPEPYAYETGFAVKWAIEDQINGVGNLNYDSSKGPVVAPLMLWGPYIWATETPRSDGFTWTIDDVSSSMRWSDVRLDEGSVVLQDHKTARKTGRPRIIPLVPTVIKLLLWMRSQAQAKGKGCDQDRVFVNGRGSALSRGWLSLKMQRLRKRLGLPRGVTYYGLRHRYGLMGIRNGVNLKLLSLCMGHVRTQMTEPLS